MPDATTTLALAAIGGFRYLRSKWKEREAYPRQEVNRQVEEIAKIFRDVIATNQSKPIEACISLLALVDQMTMNCSLNFSRSLYTFTLENENPRKLEEMLFRGLDSTVDVELTQWDCNPSIIVAHLLPPEWTVATPPIKKTWDCSELRSYYTSDEAKYLKEYLEKEIGVYDAMCFYPRDYTSPRLTRHQLGVLCLVLSISLQRVPFNLRLYGSLRRYVEAVYARDHAWRQILDAVRDRTAYKKVRNRTAVRESTSEISKLQDELNYASYQLMRARNTIFPPKRIVSGDFFGMPPSNMTFGHMMMESDMSEAVYSCLHEGFEEYGIEPPWGKRSNWRGELATLYAIQRQLSLMNMVPDAARDIEFNVNSLIGKLGITEDQKRDLESRIELCFQFLSSGWAEASKKVKRALKKGKAPKPKDLQESLGLQYPLRYLKDTLNGIISEHKSLYEFLYDQKKWAGWVQQSVLKNSENLQFLLKLVDDARMTGGAPTGGAPDEGIVQAKLALKEKLQDIRE